MAKPPKVPELSTCSFSDETPTPLYRYSLEHRWDDETPAYARKTIAWVMLNPSTADGQSLDPTLRRCKGFSRGLGAGGMIVLNLFAFRSTDPTVMLCFSSSIGDLNDATIERTVARSDITHVIAGWGTMGKHLGRDRHVMQMLMGKLTALRVNKDGSPAHPLYLPSSCAPQPFGYTYPILP